MNYILADITVLLITSCEKPKPSEPEPKEARPQTSNQVKPEPAPESKSITMAYITGEDVQRIHEPEDAKTRSSGSYGMGRAT